jgi:hypothetical protein
MPLEIRLIHWYSYVFLIKVRTGLHFGRISEKTFSNVLNGLQVAGQIRETSFKTILVAY